MKILWLIPKWTLPAVDGARVATERLVRNTVLAGAEIDILCLAQKHESSEVNIDLMMNEWNVKSIKVLYRPLPNSKLYKSLFYLKSLIFKPFTPITFSSFTDNRLRKSVSNYLIDKSYDFAVLDGLHLGAIFFNKGHFVKPKSISTIIYRAHNIEQDIWYKYVKEEKNILKKLLMYYQATLVSIWESKIINASDGIAPIALEDFRDIQKINKNSNLEFTPLGLNFDSPLAYNSNEKTQLLFIGRMDWAPNVEGLKWILDDVWPKVLENRDDLILNVVGSGDKSWLQSYKNVKNIVLHGFVPDIIDVYSLSDFTIAPITFGSGTRIKVIESYAFDRSIISTTMGVQGSGLVASDYINADSTSDWIKILSTIKLSDSIEELTTRTRLKMSLMYSEKDVGYKFYTWLKTFL